MNIRIQTAAAALALTLTLAHEVPASAAETLSVWAKTLAPTVVTIKTGPLGQQSSGTGFWLDDSGHVATCLHVVRPNPRGPTATEIMVAVPIGDNVELPSGTLVFANMMAFHGTVVAEDDAMDIAILSVTPNPFHSPSILPRTLGGKDFAPTYKSVELQEKIPDKGESLMVAGFPLGQPQLEFQPATMGSLTEMNGGFRIQFSSIVNHGNSGGPLFNEKGKVVGLVCSITYDPMDGQRTGLSQAVPAAFVRQLWKNAP